ncbi:MAG: hypothetical protein NZM40_02790 [Sphingomonadaceae bacterium]|uniref:hypothetical protein n=1 Tax=Thermaurantiacus sp. TaxID=2820283 RepID=UPI00298F304E|nr:hypothetical protein [Thermaurantiacus sp.]MCS6986352.1 hypothetical protein [Sphingomonadaceae bacterium]MDW8414386.1 hypothetical protein [Thermaurantiacus sp.]
MGSRAGTTGGWIGAAAALALVFPAPALARERSARQIVERAIGAMGGEAWTRARTLQLEGRIVWYAPDRPEPRARALDYRMWRVLEEDRVDAHEAAGQVRILAREGDRTVFEVGTDGVVTWTHQGPVSADEAQRIWAANFGYGVLRHALKPGFRLERLPDDWAEGRRVHVVRVVDPAGQETLFGIDRASFLVRMVGFATPRGWHVRTYADHFRVGGFVQPGRVTLSYNGVRQNEVFWERAWVNAPLDPALFRPGAPVPPRGVPTVPPGGAGPD